MGSIFELYKTEEGRDQLQEIFTYAAQKHPLSLGRVFWKRISGLQRAYVFCLMKGGSRPL